MLSKPLLIPIKTPSGPNAREIWQVRAARLVAVFDDRQKVVDMWRRNGVTCFQVAPGDF